MQKQFAKAVNKCLVNTSGRQFSQNSLISSVNPERNHSLRVMSTPQWPVPYYQRAFRHPQNLDKKDGDLMHVAVPVHNVHAMMAKELLKLKGEGYVVEAMENHYDIDSYLTQFQDCQQFCDAYVDDLLDCLGIAHSQNQRVLGEFDLADALK